jgi:LytS/YehU family sensor histidine kinase
VEGEPGDLVIAPLILIPFMENIFKHSIEKDPESAAASVFIAVKGHQLSCIFKNNKAEKMIYPGNAASGLGISNVVKRLQLIYPGKHTIQIETQDHFFVVELQITLANKSVI